MSRETKANLLIPIFTYTRTALVPTLVRFSVACMAGTGPGIVMSQGRIRFLSIGMAVNHSRLPGAGSELSTEMRIMFGSSFSSSLRRSIAVVLLRRNPKRKSRANEHMFWLHYRGFRWVAGAKSSKPRHEAKNLALEPGL